MVKSDSEYHFATQLRKTFNNKTNKHQFND